MFKANFGIEIEFTGITRERAAAITAEHFLGTITHTYDSYDTYKIKAEDGRVWKLMSDGSITCQRKENGRTVLEGRDYSVELVSPILTYRQDIESLQGLVRKFRKAGALANSSTGIHIHLNGADHSPRSIRNFINIVASKNDLLYKALEVKAERQHYL